MAEPPPRRTTPIAAETVRSIAIDAGFDLVGFGPADPGEHGQHFVRWLAAGRHGSMHYLEANRDRALDPTRWRPGVRSAIALAVDYGGPPAALPGGGRIARYAAGRDYHRWLRERVFALRERLEAAGVPYGSMNGGTDAVPVLERALAVRAGIGFLAKSAMVISPTHGPYLQLAELLTGLDLPTDAPAAGSCGTCTACLDACPTTAITAPFQVDARRCLSYTTIELRGSIPEPLRAPQGEWLFGCDVCLEVCPFTRRSARSRDVGAARPPVLQPHRIVETWSLVDVLELTPERYEAEFTGTAMRRATRSGLRRNAAVVLGNRGDDAALPALVRALADRDPIVRGHAAWAIGRIDARHPALARARATEDDAEVRAELDAALARRGE
ncbi:MAG: tRNA epoxyqueuosine(34) reductase QueG [Planctomycetes bacterium]|nr:tRNA epoxyqueuosine(34) reductase QueG [Planctomycetota bacterium]